MDQLYEINTLGTWVPSLSGVLSAFILRMLGFRIQEPKAWQAQERNARVQLATENVLQTGSSCVAWGAQPRLTTGRRGYEVSSSGQQRAQRISGGQPRRHTLERMRPISCSEKRVVAHDNGTDSQDFAFRKRPIRGCGMILDCRCFDPFVLDPGIDHVALDHP